MGRVSRLIIISALLAGISVFGELYGALGCIVNGAVAAGIAVRRNPTTAQQPFADFRYWFMASALFAAWVIALMPFTVFPAVTLGLLCFAPVFGTQVVMVDGAISSSAGGIAQ
jgi:hypothetical protein